MFDLSWGELLIIGVVALIILGLTWLDLQDKKGLRRGVLIGLRAVTLTMGILLLLEPAVCPQVAFGHVSRERVR